MKRRDFLFNTSVLVALASGARGSALTVFETKGQYYHVEQFKDKALAHFSYAIWVDKKLVLIDPARNPKPYYDFAASKGAKIIAVIETHPHADFVSSHLEISQKTGAKLYTSKFVKAEYPHQTFDEGQEIALSSVVKLKALNTPGHSPDSISVVLQENKKDKIVFSGDSLLFGDVGRPDLRSYSGEFATQKKVLATQMYHTIQDKFAHLSDDVILFPAHGAGSLCGHVIRDVDQSTIGYEKQNNHAFSHKNEQDFVAHLLRDESPIPYYFSYNVELNRKGVQSYQQSLHKVSRLTGSPVLKEVDLVVDVRKVLDYQKSHLSPSVNIADGGKFETWLGILIKPYNPFYLVAESQDRLEEVIEKTTKIGYESFIKGGFVYVASDGVKSSELSVQDFINNTQNYTIIDVRTKQEALQDGVFTSAINIPLSDLLNRYGEIPLDKPIVIHCASGYRSGIGTSLLNNLILHQSVYDLGSNVKLFK